MGIKGLTKLLSDEAPDCVKEVDLASLTGRKVAIDASMALYQFLIAVRSGAPGQASTQLTNESGEVTSHIQGIFNRTIRYKNMTTPLIAFGFLISPLLLSVALAEC
jgi:flap endonuclease-1